MEEGQLHAQEHRGGDRLPRHPSRLRRPGHALWLGGRGRELLPEGLGVCVQQRAAT